MHTQTHMQHHTITKYNYGFQIKSQWIFLVTKIKPNQTVFPV